MGRILSPLAGTPHPLAPDLARSYDTPISGAEPSKIICLLCTPRRCAERPDPEELRLDHKRVVGRPDRRLSARSGGRVTPSLSAVPDSIGPLPCDVSGDRDDAQPP